VPFGTADLKPKGNNVLKLKTLKDLERPQKSKAEGWRFSPKDTNNQAKKGKYRTATQNEHLGMGLGALPPFGVGGVGGGGLGGGGGGVGVGWGGGVGWVLFFWGLLGGGGGGGVCLGGFFCSTVKRRVKVTGARQGG